MTQDASNAKLITPASVVHVFIAEVDGKARNRLHRGTRCEKCGKRPARLRPHTTKRLFDVSKCLYVPQTESDGSSFSYEII